MPAPPRCLRVVAGALVVALARGAVAQPVDPVEIPVALRAGDVPEAPGVGAQAMAVLAFFHGFPSDLRDARELLDGRSIAPAFHAWCGVVPYVDFGNGTVADSTGQDAPTQLCLPFYTAMPMMPSHTCRRVDGLPTGAYDQGGGLVLRIQGNLAFRSAGTYTLAWGHDDGVGFSVGDVPVFEFRDPTGSRVDRRAVRVAEAGIYPFTLEWYDTIGGALIDWYIAEGDRTDGTFDASRFRLVPQRDLYPNDALPCTPRCERCSGETPRCDHGAGRCVACLRDTDCAACQVCAEGRCRPVREVPGADAGSGCGEDVPLARDAGETVDALMFDGAVEAGVTMAPAPGCSCAAGRVRWRGDAWWPLMVAALRRRRRR